MQCLELACRGKRLMRKQWIVACLLLVGAFAGPSTNQARAQPSTPLGTGNLAGPGWDISGQPSITTPTPLGPSNPNDGGLYFAAEFMFMHGDRALGNQVIMSRGFRDTDGSVTGTPGQFVGSNNIAMSTTDLGRTSWTPGYRATLGYKLDDGTSFSISYAQFLEVHYNFAAGPIPPDFNTGSQQVDSFLFAPVYGFSPQFSGPPNKLSGAAANGTITTIGSGSSPYGIWNGATTAQEMFIQRFSNWDITGRFNVFESNYARSYATAGGRFAWFWDEFKWDVSDAESNGGIAPQDTANYRNIMSQRMYGPFIGFGQEMYLGNALAVSLDGSAAALLDVIKERAFYVLGDGSTESKRARDDYAIVPNLNASANVWWYPIEGMQVKFGYDIYTFFNTQYMQQPVGFNAGGPDPSYKALPFRMVHGLHVGVGYAF